MSGWTRRTWAAALLAGATLHGAGAAQPARVAVPYYTPADFARGAYAHWYAPQAARFAQDAAGLRQTLDQFCGGTASLDQVRRQWGGAVQSWERLSAVAVGPLLQRRSARQIDFAPTRPALIERALAQAPADLAALERVGTPAKGFPALEWLLWTKPVASGSPACRYAQLLAAEIGGEAAALSGAFQARAARDWKADEAGARAAMAELLNQWVGGVERLRWAQMEKPLRSAGAGAPAFPRAAAGATRQSWNTHWSALRELGVLGDRAAPAPGSGLVPLELYLRGRGLNPLADRLAAATMRAGKAIAAAQPTRRSSVLAGAAAASGLKRLAEAQVAPALEVQIGFSDSDGD